MSSYDIYANIRNEKGLTDYRVAKDTGIGTATLSNWKNGKYTPKADKLAKIAEYLGVSPDEFGAVASKRKNIIRVYHPSREEKPQIAREPSISYSDLFTGRAGLRVSFRIPVLGRVAAGIPIEATEDIIDWEEITESMKRDGDYFALKIQGDSMEPKISNGDVVIVRQQEDADDGDIVIALIDGEDAVCKKIKKYPDGSVALVSTNPVYEPLFFTQEEIIEKPVKVIGKVKELRAKF